MAPAIKIETTLAVVACWMFLSCLAANVPQTETGRSCQYVEAQSTHILSIQPALARRMRLTVSFRAWFRQLSSTGGSSFVLSVGEAPARPYELLRLASKTRAELSTCRGLALTEKGESFPVLLLRNASVEVASMSHIFISHFKALGSDQLTITYHCGQSQTRQCIKVDTSSAFQHTGDNNLHRTRNKRTTNLSFQNKSSLSYSSYSVPAIMVCVVVGLLALMAVIAICAKGTEPREHTGESSLKSSAQQNENQEAPTADDRPVSATEEVKIVMDSPVVANSSENSGQAGALADSGNHSETDQLSSRKSMEPLPLPPEAEAPQANANRPTPPPPSPPGDDEDEEEDNPYDYARVPGRESDVELSENDSADEAQQDEDGAARGPPGRYAKVTRHSASKETDYEPMPDLPRPPLPSMRERRDRSATDPVDPMCVGERKTRSMTVVAESASGMPLPAVPPVKFIGEEPEDDMYDCIKDDLKAAIRQSTENQSPQKVYDSVDGENDMYESVTEEMKESVQQQVTPALPLSPVPKSQQKANSNSPSPTKRHSGSGFLDSPKTRKAKEAAKRMNSKDASKEGKKKNLTAPQDGESRSRHFSFIFNRKKTPSVSGKPLSPETKPETPQEQLPSPGHRPFSSVPLPSIPPSLGPRPAVPIPRPVSYTGHNDDPDEDEGGMYDSVTQPMSRSVPDSDDTMPKLVSATRGGGGGGANPHFNEPLPDVPEDSGSGSAGGGASVVKHPRLVEMSDPSYDTVISTRRQEELPCDPNYDTVQLPQFARKPQQQPQPVNASTTTPPYRPSPERDESVSHDEQGYAVVDPNVILRKRVSSLSKSAMKEANDEPGYEKVKKDDLPTDDQSEEPGYESVTKQQEVEYDSLDQISGTEPIQPVEPGYASVTRLLDGTPKLEQDESAKEPGYEKVRTDTSSNDDQTDKQQEPNYDSVTEQEEPEYDSLDQIEKTVQQSVEPGYATVTGHMAAGISKPSTTGDQDDMYSHVDLAKKHKIKETNPPEMLSSIVQEEDRITSPAPPIPAQGDLGDISEFEAPPIPEPQFDLLDEVIEPPYATVTKSGSNETRKTPQDPMADESEQVNQSETEAVDETSSTQADSTGSEPTATSESTAESVPEPTAEAKEEEVVVTNTSSAEHDKVNSTPADEEHTESTPSSETPVNTTQENQTEGTSISVTATTTDISTDKPNSVSTNRSSLEESQPMYDSLELSVPSSQPNHTTSEAAKLPGENVYDSLLAVQAQESS